MFTLTFKVFSVLAVLASSGYTINSQNIQGDIGDIGNKFDEYVFHESVKKFQDFTNDFLRESFALADFEGSNVVFPLGVAHMLAVLNEQKFWDISTTGVDYALWTSKENLTLEYTTLLNAINKQNSLRGVITSWSDFIGNSEGLAKLNVKLENRRAIQDDALEENQLVSRPSFSWDRSQRDNAGTPFRKALFANTMFLPNYWFRELAAVGKGVFNGEVNTPFLESKGHLRTQETEDFIAVSFPLATFGQNLILVLPKTNLAAVVDKKNLQHFIQYPPRSAHWKFEAMRVYVPLLNFITPENTFKPLSKLGVQQLMCNPEAETQLQPISQASYIYLGTDGFDILTITSTDLINVTEYKNMNNLFKREAVIQRVRRSTEEIDKNTEFFKKFGYVNPLYALGGSFDQDLLVWAAHDANTPQANTEYRTVAFNQPFYWYLHDENIGPSVAGIVESIAQTPKTYYEEPFGRKSFNEWIKDMDATYEVPKCF